MMKRIKQSDKPGLLSLLIGLVFCFPAGAQTLPEQDLLPSDTLQYRLTFVVDSLLNVDDPGESLISFARELKCLKAGKDTVIQIVHLGDSHVQAGFLTGQVMRLLHREYGNAGRGWIAPFKLSKTNEPDDYYIQSSAGEWVAGRVIQSTRKAPVGPGGIGIRANASSIRFDITIAPKNGAGYEFNEVIWFRHDRAMPMLPHGDGKDSTQVSHGIYAVAPAMKTDTFRLPGLFTRWSVQSTRTMPETNITLPAADFENNYYGAILKNGSPGILYHSIGVNGAMFVNYTDEVYVRQLAELKPALLIISLGTNETFGRRFRPDEFKDQVACFLDLVRNVLPETAVLLTTPAECYKRQTVNGKRTYVRNEQTETAARVIRTVAAERGLACWDMFRATGGATSSRQWFNGKWMGADRIHFNKEGYREQGKLLFTVLNRLESRYIFSDTESNDADMDEPMQITDYNVAF